MQQRQTDEINMNQLKINEIDAKIAALNKCKEERQKQPVLIVEQSVEGQIVEPQPLTTDEVLEKYQTVSNIEDLIELQKYKIEYPLNYLIDRLIKEKNGKFLTHIYLYCEIEESFNSLYIDIIEETDMKLSPLYSQIIKILIESNN